MTGDWKRDPFPHAVLDGLWNPDELRAAAAEFPGPEDPRWITYPQPEEWGKRAGDERMWTYLPAARKMLEKMKRPAARKDLQALTGIADLSPDLLGGGLHMTCDGGRLALHRDFSVHPDGRVRRLNVLVFLNEEWERDWGGVLYLGADRQVEVMPLFNRTVVFECGPESWHGHPDPVQPGHCRKSLACYWYTPPAAGTAHHSTIWLGR